MLTNIQENSEFNIIRCAKPHIKKMPRENIIIVAWFKNQDDAWPMGRDTQDVERATTSRKSATTPTEEHLKWNP